MRYSEDIGRDVVARADVTARVVVALGWGDAAPVELLKRRAPLARVLVLGGKAAGADAAIGADIATGRGQAALDRALGGAAIDHLLLGPGLGELPQAGAALAPLRARMRPGAGAVACIANAAHWSVLARLLGGGAGAEGEAPLPRFSREAAAALFRASGFAVESAVPLPAAGDRPPAATATGAVAALAGAARTLGLEERPARDRLAAAHWLFTLRAGEARERRPLVAVGIRSAALSLSTIRLIQPFEALAGYRPLRQSVTLGEFVLPREGIAPPGVIVTYRLHPASDSPVWPRFDRLAAEGWLIVQDLDDHPAYLKAQRANDFRSIRAAHAVTVTTPALAEVVRPMNPHVHLLPNQVFDLPAPRETILAPGEGPLRALFAAINREGDWEAQCGALEALLAHPQAPARLTILHAPRLAERMGPSVRSLPFLDYPDYRREMLSADVALAPLVASEFNDCKSDLKIVECLAHGTVPVVSAQAAARTDVPRDLMLVAAAPRDWARHLRALSVDREMLAAMKAEGLDWVIRNRMWHGHVAALDALHDRLLADLPQLETDRRARLAGLGLAQGDALGAA